MHSGLNKSLEQTGVWPFICIKLAPCIFTCCYFQCHLLFRKAALLRPPGTRCFSLRADGSCFLLCPNVVTHREASIVTAGVRFKCLSPLSFLLLHFQKKKKKKDIPWDFAPYWHESIAQLLQICWLNISGVHRGRAWVGGCPPLWFSCWKHMLKWPLWRQNMCQSALRPVKTHGKVPSQKPKCMLRVPSWEPKCGKMPSWKLKPILKFLFGSLNKLKCPLRHHNSCLTVFLGDKMC